MRATLEDFARRLRRGAVRMAEAEHHVHGRMDDAPEGNGVERVGAP
jgi:hypothetical protein